MVHRILVASYTNDIVTLTFDPDTSSLSVSSSIEVGFHPSWITANPKHHPGVVWTGLEQPEGKVLALKYDEEGKLEKLAEAESAGHSPCSLLALKDEVLVANYMSGTIGSLSISPSNPNILPPTTASVQLSGTGPNKDRQEGSHPHQVVYHEEYEELLVPDLGADAVYRLKRSPKDASWKLVGHIGFEAGGGPRHVVVYENSLFTLLELSSKVVRHTFPPLPALPKLIKSTPTMSNPQPTPNDMLAAEIYIPQPNKTYPTPYLYLSNRNDPSPEGDLISIFAITDSEGKDGLELVNEIRTGLKHVRGMVFGGEDDKYVVVGGANGGGVKVFERVEGGRGLRLVSACEGVQGPTGFLWL
ncbi:Lactonase, 7-bladed beta-propeller-domain-containing protein [Panaeolus papilionaceus]|nr:Lactonase, 7-bladed beta-propeller-domain-containing protein [Panaeolus papilionaceus]